MTIKAKQYQQLSIRGYIMFYTLLPAYGRDYKNQKSLKSDWNNNKDFIIAETRQYINKQDAKNYGLTDVIFRYSQKRKVMSMSIK